MDKKRKKTLFPLLLAVTLTSLLSPAASDDAAVMQSLAIAIKPLPSGWTTTAGADPCGKTQWDGVSCDPAGKVTVINLRGMSLQGILPRDLSKLDSLQSLSLQGNGFSGLLPSLEGMSGLQEVYLSDNNFTSVPDTFFSGLTNLVNMSLDRNPFAEWSIPDDLGHSANLVSFTAMNAGVVGPIPAFFGTMVSLQMLRLSYNSLVGAIPDTFRSSGLRELYLNSQKPPLSGRLDVLGYMTQITVFMVQSNNFTGPIPDLANCTSLESLSVRDNQLTGVVPESLASLPALGNLSLANNLLQGPFPGISSGVWKDDADSGNSFCNSKPGPCDPRVTTLLKVVSGFGYPIVIANSWKGNDPCKSWLFVTCDPKGNVIVLTFTDQGFGGVISPAVADISTLRSLYLQGNNLNGTIPDGLTKLPQLQVLNVSDNNLSGKIPAFSKNVNFIYGGNPNLGKDLGGSGKDPNTPGPASAASTAGKSGSLKTRIALIVVAVVIFAGGLVAFFIHRRMRTPKFKMVRTQSPQNGNVSLQVYNTSSTAAPSAFRNEGTGSNVQGSSSHVIELGSLNFSIEALRRATDNFNEANVLGRGGFGVVYRGQQPDGTVFAVKRMECGEMGNKGMSEFQAEIGMLTKVRHRHLVALLGYCTEGNERLLVYEYMPQGTLGQHVFARDRGQYPPLNWKQRLVISLDVARGLEYLHSLAQTSFIHRDLKPSNILLDNDLRAKVSDFGLVKHAPDGKHSLETRLAGTFGYLAPEYATTGRVSTKVDVYAFGVVLMELISGRKALDDSQSEENVHLVSWFRRVLVNRDNVIKAIDPTLELDEEDVRSVSVVAELAVHCTSRELNQRPEMNNVVNVIAPLVEHWKPSGPNTDNSFTSGYTDDLAERLRRWQANEGTSMMGLSFTNTGEQRMDNTQSSMLTKPDMFPHGR